MPSKGQSVQESKFEIRWFGHKSAIHGRSGVHYKVGNEEPLASISTTELDQSKIDEELRKLVPEISSKDYEVLKRSIKAQGLQSPIDALPDGRILDGYTRFQICRELGIEPKYRTVEIPDRTTEKLYVLEANLARRHLNDYQKAELAQPLLAIEEELAEKRQKTGTSASNEAKGKSSSIVARKVGLSPSTFERATAIIRDASKEWKEQLREGKTTINKVYENIQPHKSYHHHDEKPGRIARIRAVLNFAILRNLSKEGAGCPICGNKTLTYTCHNLSIESATTEAFNKANQKLPKDFWKVRDRVNAKIEDMEENQQKLSSPDLGTEMDVGPWPHKE